MLRDPVRVRVAFLRLQACGCSFPFAAALIRAQGMGRGQLAAKSPEAIWGTGCPHSDSGPWIAPTRFGVGYMVFFRRQPSAGF